MYAGKVEWRYYNSRNTITSNVMPRELTMKGALPHPLRNGNPFKLGLFSVNADGGLAFTTVENRWRADWDDIAAMAQLGDKAGIEFILPIARWKGYGGETNARGTSFETLTHSAGLAAMT